MERTSNGAAKYWQCGVCSKLFLSGRSYAAHVRWHTKEDLAKAKETGGLQLIPREDPDPMETFNTLKRETTVIESTKVAAYRTNSGQSSPRRKSKNNSHKTASGSSRKHKRRKLKSPKGKRSSSSSSRHHLDRDNGKVNTGISSAPSYRQHSIEKKTEKDSRFIIYESEGPIGQWSEYSKKKKEMENETNSIYGLQPYSTFTEESKSLMTPKELIGKAIEVCLKKQWISGFVVGVDDDKVLLLLDCDDKDSIMTRVSLYGFDNDKSLCVRWRLIDDTKIKTLSEEFERQIQVLTTTTTQTEPKHHILVLHQLVSSIDKNTTQSLQSLNNCIHSIHKANKHFYEKNQEKGTNIIQQSITSFFQTSSSSPLSLQSSSITDNVNTALSEDTREEIKDHIQRASIYIKKSISWLKRFQEIIATSKAITQHSLDLFVSEKLRECEQLNATISFIYDVLDDETSFCFSSFHNEIRSFPDYVSLVKAQGNVVDDIKSLSKLYQTIYCERSLTTSIEIGWIALLLARRFRSGQTLDNLHFDLEKMGIFCRHYLKKNDDETNQSLSSLLQWASRTSSCILQLTAAMKSKKLDQSAEKSTVEESTTIANDDDDNDNIPLQTTEEKVKDTNLTLANTEMHFKYRVEKTLTSIQYFKHTWRVMLTEVGCPLCDRSRGFFPNGRSFAGHFRHCKDSLPRESSILRACIKELSSKTKESLRKELSEYSHSEHTTSSSFKELHERYLRVSKRMNSHLFRNLFEKRENTSLETTSTALSTHMNETNKNNHSSSNSTTTSMSGVVTLLFQGDENAEKSEQTSSLTNAIQEQRHKTLVSLRKSLSNQLFHGETISAESIKGTENLSTAIIMGNVLNTLSLSKIDQKTSFSPQQSIFYLLILYNQSKFQSTKTLKECLEILSQFLECSARGLSQWISSRLLYLPSVQDAGRKAMKWFLSCEKQIKKLLQKSPQVSFNICVSTPSLIQNTSPMKLEMSRKEVIVEKSLSLLRQEKNNFNSEETHVNRNPIPLSDRFLNSPFLRESCRALLKSQNLSVTDLYLLILSNGIHDKEDPLEFVSEAWYRSWLLSTRNTFYEEEKQSSGNNSTSKVSEGRKENSNFRIWKYATALWVNDQLIETERGPERKIILQNNDVGETKDNKSSMHEERRIDNSTKISTTSLENSFERDTLNVYPHIPDPTLSTDASCIECSKIIKAFIHHQKLSLSAFVRSMLKDAKENKFTLYSGIDPWLGTQAERRMLPGCSYFMRQHKLQMNSIRSCGVDMARYYNLIVAGRSMDTQNDWSKIRKFVHVNRNGSQKPATSPTLSPTKSYDTSLHNQRASREMKPQKEKDKSHLNVINVHEGHNYWITTSRKIGSVSNNRFLFGHSFLGSFVRIPANAHTPSISPQKEKKFRLDKDPKKHQSKENYHLGLVQYWIPSSSEFIVSLMNDSSSSNNNNKNSSSSTFNTTTTTTTTTTKNITFSSSTLTVSAQVILEGIRNYLSYSQYSTNNVSSKEKTTISSSKHKRKRRSKNSKMNVLKVKMNKIKNDLRSIRTNPIRIFFPGDIVSSKFDCEEGHEWDTVYYGEVIGCVWLPSLLWDAKYKHSTLKTKSLPPRPEPPSPRSKKNKKNKKIPLSLYLGSNNGRSIGYSVRFNDGDVLIGYKATQLQLVEQGQLRKRRISVLKKRMKTFRLRLEALEDSNGKESSTSSTDEDTEESCLSDEMDIEIDPKKQELFDIRKEKMTFFIES